MKLRDKRELLKVFCDLENLLHEHAINEDVESDRLALDYLAYQFSDIRWKGIQCFEQYDLIKDMLVEFNQNQLAISSSLDQ